MLGAFAKAFGQLGDRRIARVLVTGIALAVAVFVGLWTAVSLVLTRTQLFETVWLDATASVLGGLATLALSWLLFPAVVSATIGVLLDGVAAAVEERHYPGREPPRSQTLAEIVLGSVRFLAVLVALNVVALAFLAVPLLFPFVFFAINGYLLGREYFELVAVRRMAPARAEALRRAHRWRVTAAGVLIALLLTVPLANLVAPIVGTAAMVHIFEELRRAG